MSANPGVADELEAIYSYMRNFWEHIIAHYMYAFGKCIIIFKSYLIIDMYSQVLYGCHGYKSLRSGISYMGHLALATRLYLQSLH